MQEIVPGDCEEDLVGAHDDAAHVRDDHRHHFEHPELHAQHQAPVIKLEKEKCQQRNSYYGIGAV